MERFDAFCQAVCRQVRHATPRERRAIRAELTGHLEDRAEDLRQRGMPEEEAEERAVAAMGDPEAIGRELNRQYPLGWLIVSRCALVLAAAWCCICSPRRWPHLPAFRAISPPGRIRRWWSSV